MVCQGGSVMVKLIAEENHCKTTITFNEPNKDKEEKYLTDFKMNPSVKKIIRIEDEEEVILLER